MSQIEMKVLRFSPFIELHTKQVFQGVCCSVLHVCAEEFTKLVFLLHIAIGCRFFLFESIHLPSKLA